MKIFADLHIHGKYSRATSKELDIDNLVKWAKIKGINLLGTGDFTHPVWLKHLKDNLVEERQGIYETKDGFPFILQVEISNIYSQGNETRRIHNIILAPSFEAVGQINESLARRGRLDYDGRPIFGFSCVELVEMMREISSDIEIIPAHAWTPWFSIFGSKSGFDSIDDCFQEKSKYIHAIETGLSSDPAMNWRLSQLDNITLVSFSDSHSFWPWRIGREATVFDLEALTYKNLINAIRTKNGLTETIEVNPAYGKYHWDGHRDCNISMSSSESKKYNKICPVCKKTLTIGVEHRVEELADRPSGYKPEEYRPFRSLIPLSEIISSAINSQPYTKKTWDIYYKLTKAFGSEFEVLLNADGKEIKNLADEKISEAILKNRSGNIKIVPGFDGVYGYPVFNDKPVKKMRTGKTRGEQKSLADFRHQ